MKYAVVTTFHKNGYDLYGKRMIQTFTKNWPKDITLYVYHENVSPTEKALNLVLRDLNESSPELVAFKNKWKNDPKANGGVEDSANTNDKKAFKWDAVRFAHKVYAIFDCAKNCDADVLFWMDADTVCHSPISMGFIEKMTNDIDLGFLGRKGKYTECGLYSMNLRSESVKAFLKEFQWAYDNAEKGIFTMREWHDSYVFDQIRAKTTNLKEYNWSAGLIEGEGHPLINSEWGAYLDHLKGQRKATGRSKSKDLKTPRNEAYWR